MSHTKQNDKNMPKPLKRHQSLIPLSRDHHHGLLLCWKIREARKKDVEPQRLKAYLDFFYDSHLKPHFQFEEKEVFPLLGRDHEIVQKALGEHRRLRALFAAEKGLEKAFADIEKELEAHIRFEERKLFQEIQQTVSSSDLRALEAKEKEMPNSDPEAWEDKFWLKEH